FRTVLVLNNSSFRNISFLEIDFFAFMFVVNNVPFREED
ncbi:MAG: hypothetical protein ACI91R_001594, partial [Vicingaceae bacterium]